jgi:HAD superfamily hydrolase (TIGR01458 family)
MDRILMKLLLDLDGTLLDYKKPNLDAIPFMEEVSRRKIHYKIMTNSIRSPLAIKDRLESAGIHVNVDDILNPITAINQYLEAKQIKEVYFVGSSAEIDQATAHQNTTDPDAIVLLDFEKNNITYSELQQIFLIAQRGTPMLAASNSPWYSKDGRKQMDTGSFVSLFAAATGNEIVILGKPSKEYFAVGISSLDANPDDVFVIGDDWKTDINGATEAGCRSILVKSGKYQPADELKCNPTRVISHLMEIFDL